jgi:molybdopterin molybdotransferase
MISVEEARTRILTAFQPLPAVLSSLDTALGRVLAEDVVARVTQPPVSVSAMDGYAVRAADAAQVPVTLKQIGEAPAGGSFKGTVGPGECVRIFTGGPVPSGADAVVIQEDTVRDDATITVNEPAKLGRHIRVAGLDFRTGDVGIEAGHVLTSRDIGFAAAMNHPWLKVRRKPRVAIIATGDEVVLPGDPLGPNQIVSSNGPALAAFVSAAALQRMADGARGADLLVTTGGASVGDHDLVRSALGAAGLVLDFWQIAMRPGKPLIFGRIGDTPMLGLPGNPVSSLVCALVFLRPALHRMLGLSDPDGRRHAYLGCDLAQNDRREDYLRATLTTDENGRPVATPFPKQDSSMMSLLAKSGCLVIRKPHAPPAKRGDSVEIVPLDCA